MFDDTRDFIQAHFVISPREDTAFWKSNKHDLVISDNIKEKMAMYKAGLPVNMPITDEGNYYGNFEAEFRNFWTNGSYYCIFAGLGLVPDRPLPALLHKPESRRNAEPLFEEVARKQAELVRELPSTYEYLRKLHGRMSERPSPTSAVMPARVEAGDEELSTTRARAKS